MTPRQCGNKLTLLWSGLLLCAWMGLAQAQDFAPPEFPEPPPEKTPLPPTPSRLIDNKDGTVTDPRENLMWQQSDSYQEKKEWMSWIKGQQYIRDLNEKSFAGYNDWRLPSRKELQSLYDQTKEVKWTYYWNTYSVNIDPVFGPTSCCFWTGEEHKEKFAWGFNFIRGQTYPSPKDGPQLSLSVIRAVRSLAKGAGTAP